MSSKTIVFDLDDTLVKEIDFLKSAFQAIAKEVEPQNLFLFENMMSWYYQKENVFLRLANTYGVFIEDLKGMYRNHLPNFDPNSPEKAFLKQLKEKDFRLGLITDGYSITQRNKLKALQIENLFDLIVISEEFGSSKPNRENFLVFHQFKTEEYFYIGDNTSKDFLAPNQLGWETVCVLDDGDHIHKQNFDLESVYLPKRLVNKVTSIDF